MHYGLAYANTGPATEPAFAARFAKAAEDAGYQSLWTVEHVIWPASYSSVYPYHPSGKMPGDHSIPLPDPLIWLTWVAAATSTIRLATGILLLPERQPLVVGKELATLDVVSGGRLDLGIGIGWLREEFEALDIPFAGRAARTDEYVAALRTMWRSDAATFDGDFVSFRNVSSNPKPVNGSVPVFVGGHSEGAARRAGRLGDGFWPGRGDAAEVGRLFEIVRQAAEDAGRDPNSIEMCASPSHGIRRLDEEVGELHELGVDRILIPAFYFFRDPEQSLPEVMARLP